MAKLLLLLTSGLALIVLAFGFQQKQFRCSSTDSYGTSLVNFQLSCIDNIPKRNSHPSTYPKQWLEKIQAGSPARMLDFVEHCTCALLSMSMIWETMLTHEIEILFAVSREFVEEFQQVMETAALKIEDHNKKVLEELEKEKAEGANGIKPNKKSKRKELKEEFKIARRNNPLFAGDDGDSLYHYYVLFNIVNSAQTPSEKANFINKIMLRTASIYFDLQHLESTYKSAKEFPGDHPINLIVKGACGDLRRSFHPYLEALSQLKLGFNNDMWVYRVVSHDETLYKLVIVSMLCQTINEEALERERAMQAARPTFLPS